MLRPLLCDHSFWFYGYTDIQWGSFTVRSSQRWPVDWKSSQTKFAKSVSSYYNIRRAKTRVEASIDMDWRWKVRRSRLACKHNIHMSTINTPRNSLYIEYLLNTEIQDLLLEPGVGLTLDFWLKSQTGGKNSQTIITGSKIVQYWMAVEIGPG